MEPSIKSSSATARVEVPNSLTSPAESQHQTQVAEGGPDLECVANVLRIVITLGCIFLFFIAFSSFMIILLTDKVSTFAFVEFAFLLVEIFAGLYATIYRNRLALIIFAALSFLNGFGLSTKLILDLQTNEAGIRAASFSISKPKFGPLDARGGKFLELSDANDGAQMLNCDCYENGLNCAKTCCHNLDVGCKFATKLLLTYRGALENSNGAMRNSAYSDERLIRYILLWFIAGFSLLLGLLASLIAACGNRENPQPAGLSNHPSDEMLVSYRLPLLPGSRKSAAQETSLRLQQTARS